MKNDDMKDDLWKVPVAIVGIIIFLISPGAILEYFNKKAEKNFPTSKLEKQVVNVSLNDSTIIHDDKTGINYRIYKKEDTLHISYSEGK